MKVTYSEKAKQWSEGYALIQQATKKLEEAVGKSSDPITAAWDRLEDARGRPVYLLTVRDLAGEVQSTFSPQELKTPSYMHASIYHLWGDLLKVRWDEQHRKVQELVQQMEGS